MKNKTMKKVISAAMAVIMISAMAVQPLTIAAYATEGDIAVADNSDIGNTGSTGDSSAVQDTTSGTENPSGAQDGSDNTQSTDNSNNSSSDSDNLNNQENNSTTNSNGNSNSNDLKCNLCGDEHETKNCEYKCTEHFELHKDVDCPRFGALGNNIYITNYEVVNANGSPLAKVNPGDKVIVAVSVIDERIDVKKFGNFRGQSTGRIHVNMAQGAFSIPSSAVIDVKMREPVTVYNAENYPYQALCYTIYFRDVTYLGGSPEFGFGISYTGQDGTNIDNNMPLPYPHTTLNMNITQATDDVPAPTIILNNANYGKVAIIGETFALSTTATNTSTNLELDNVSLKIVLPNGITLANGNSQVLIGKVPRGGQINHTFSLIAEGVANDITSLPVQLIYTFEAFVNGKRTQFTSQQDISINVQQPTRFDIQSMFNDMEMFMGNESYMSASLVNKGKTTVYNVTAELVSDTLTAYDVEFLGNIMPGSTADAEFDFTASQVGTATGKLVVTYEDASGTQSTLEREFTIEVLEEMVWDEPVINQPVVEPVEPKTSYTPYIIGVVAVGAAAGFFFWKKKQKSKRLAELEDEDEDI